LENKHITKVFNESNLCIAYKTYCSVKQLLNPRTPKNDENKFHCSGIYQLTCTDCRKKYTRKTGSNFEL